MSELDRLPARGVMQYGAACLAREALLIARQMDMAMLAAETLAGGSRTLQRLQRQARGMLGVSVAAPLNTEEQAAVAEVEREIAAQFPFYRDPQRLNEIHDAIGMMRLRRCPTFWR
ncbi:MAG TPA: hypothetical protein VFW87_00525 [Pirellulales bacterium]|nr:hypothetical protein [Pirellulales bacterium]